jgi:hypothetical protein
MMTDLDLDLDRQLAAAVLDVLLAVSPNNAAHGNTSVLIPRAVYNNLREKFEPVWPGAYDRARALAQTDQGGQ